MSLGYKLVVDGPCLRVLFSVARSQRDKLTRALEELADNPFQAGDYELRIPNDRTYQLKLLRPFKITYWADHAVKELRVVEIDMF